MAKHKVVSRRAGLTVPVLLSVAGVLPTPVPATAQCSNKEQIFWADEPGYSWRLNAFGSMNDIRFVKRDTEDCSTTTGWSTEHIKGGGVWGDWVEVGWRIKTTCTSYACADDYQWFSEWGTDFDSDGGDHGQYPCNEVEGDFHRWRVSNKPDTNDWTLSVNCLTGSGYDQLDVATNTGHHKGTPTGETGRRGGTGTGISDRHRNLKWKDSGEAWNDWVDPTCRDDNASNWQGVRDSATEYHTEHGSADC